MSYWFKDYEVLGTVTIGGVDYTSVVGVLYADTSADLPSRLIGTRALAISSTCHVIDTGEDYMLDTYGNWNLQQSATSVTLDLSGYYTSAETDTAISDAITDFQTNTADHRYLRVGTGTTLADGTNLNSCTTLGKYRNSNASNGCRNMPLEVAGRPFTLTVENMYGNQRYKQTLWLGQANYVDRFYWRIMTTNDPDTGWSDWYKVTGTAVPTDVPTP